MSSGCARSGYPVYRYKLASFAHRRNALAGLAGYLSALQFGFVNPGASVLAPIRQCVADAHSWRHRQPLRAPSSAHSLSSRSPRVFQSLTRHWQLLLGGTIILLVIFLPGGLASVAGRFRRTLIGEPGNG